MLLSGCGLLQPSISPGRARPGLIEAGGSVGIQENYTGSPGRARPGLIEAPYAKEKTRRGFAYLRGARAPASLKLVNGGMNRAERKQISGARAPRPH